MKAIKLGKERALEKYGDILVNFILCSFRNSHSSKTVEMVELAIKYNREKLVNAVDLVGPEKNYSCVHHKEAFQTANNNNLRITIHAGESDGPNSIKNAISHCFANRIGHGTSLIKDETLLKKIKDDRIPIEICITSNVQTNKYIDDYKDHPIHEFYKQGLNLSICTDNTTMSNITLTEEFYLLQKHFDMYYLDVLTLISNSLHSAFLTPSELNDIKQKFISSTVDIFKTHHPTISQEKIISTFNNLH
eukprot:TRINITY_DN7245_c0_g1_i1.p1 TRINITY_DN7245_c0_g1~~TRINITY_DN7245_c0_g1_i1.p1  ORF type:complete len:248 (+),score=54.06 TRINITY_DN7245_c0_g1_i1:2-745(+)